MAVKKKSEKRIKKEEFWFKVQKAAAQYKNALFIDANNVSSKQIADIRVELRKVKALMVMGKNVSLFSHFSQITL
jgi:ribosomal protein L10